ncbi:MAG: hypothetical protein DRJ66_05980 [Thermoprotei archaeon]|nr:MAG: hypothetical protein DRJ66_05980 [Thermoprotei archaeon]RLF19788.1 MAG: hypothetical protein DRZ82_04600 [Thermoprotei archaeon]
MSDELSTIKILGGIGSVLVILSLAHWAIGIIGLVLLFIAFKKVADYYRRPEIFKNALIALILSIIGLAIFGITIGVILLKLLFSFPKLLLGFGFGTEVSIIGNVLYPSLKGVIVHILLVFSVLPIFNIISAVFLRRSLNVLAEVSRQSLFKTAGLLYLIGSCLLINSSQWSYLTNILHHTSNSILHNEIEKRSLT